MPPPWRWTRTDWVLTLVSGSIELGVVAWLVHRKFAR